MAKSDLKNIKGTEVYLASVKARGYENLKPYKRNMSIDDLAAEGMKLLEVDVILPVTPKKSLEDALGDKSDNPYIKARTQILNQMVLSRKERILKIEQDKTTEHSFEYKAFVEQVRKLGDELSNTISTPKP